MKKVILALLLVVSISYTPRSQAQENNCADGWLCGATMSSVAYLGGGFPYIQTATCCDYSSATNACNLGGQTSRACNGERINGGFIVSIAL